ncbi:MAG: pitrilysin family protein [Gillisia sp.]
MLIFFPFCLTAQEKGKQYNVNFESFTLQNGLRVILHEDHSDPVVAVALTAHVGSSREIENRTGFAHLFEHLLFLQSENLGKGGLDKMSARIGGSGANGSTNRDRTNFFQTVPNDALEKMIWAEADKLGFFINTVTDPVLAKEKEVVKNEKRQSVDNRPYGHTMEIIDKNLYPPSHPYHWEIIGSLEDLQNATLQNVKDFYNKWYVPNNVVLTIAGDFDKAQAKEWVHKYFDEIKSGQDFPRREKQPVTLKASKNLYFEDNFANLPQLSIAWPTVYSYAADSYALEVLASYLANGKNAPLYKSLVEKHQLTDAVRMYDYTSELAGQMMLQVTAYDKKDLDSVKAVIDETFKTFAQEGIPQKDLKRIKAGQETDFYNSISSVLGKGFQLAQYQIFANDPNEINKNVEKIRNVSKEDVIRVFKKYIYNQPYVVTSFVPKGQKELALKNAEEASVPEEKIVEGAEKEVNPNQALTFKKTPSSFDRSVEPPYWGTPEITTPDIWKINMPSGLTVLGITSQEVPLINFRLEMYGGLLLENPDKIGVSNLLAELLTKGTATKTPQELEEAIELLGSSIDVRAEDDKIILSGSTLSKNYQKTMDLVREILLQPRWDKKEFELAKQKVKSEIRQQKANPNRIAENEFRKKIYGKFNVLSHDILGTEASVEKISLQDLKDYYRTKLSPLRAKFLLAGDVNKEEARASVNDLSAEWQPTMVQIPQVPAPNVPQNSQVYFYDIPGAKQSVLRIGAPALAATDSLFYPAEVMNYRLGGGGFASELTQELREAKGYTYGIRSRFEGSKNVGPFVISSGVRSNITGNALELIKKILQEYPQNFTDHDLEVTKSFMIKSDARKFETLNSKLEMLSDISNYNLDNDFVKKREKMVQNMTVEDIRELAKKYANPGQMYYIVVGDAATQIQKMEDLGYGKPILLNEE